MSFLRKLLASFLLALAFYIGSALPRNDLTPAQGIHNLPSKYQNEIIFGDGAHKRWKMMAESQNFTFKSR